MTPETAKCKKCQSEISIKAERCPHCQYEPGKAVLGPIGSVLGFLLLFGAMFQVLLGVLLLLTPIAGAPITSALTGFIIFLISGIIQGAIAIWLGGFQKKYAADRTSEEPEPDPKSTSEAWQEGRERSEKWQKRVTDKIDETPPVFFSVSIAVGTVFSFATVIIAGTKAEIAWIVTEDLVGLSLFLSIGVLLITVFTDVYRVNRIYQANFRAWLYALPSMIPFVGFIPATIWVLRRKYSGIENNSEK